MSQVFKPRSCRTLQSHQEEFANHLIRVSLERHQVPVRVQMIHGIHLPFIHSELRWQFKLGGDPGPHHPFYEWQLGQPYQGIYSNWSIFPCVNGINFGIQVPDPSCSGLLLVLGCLVITTR